MGRGHPGRLFRRSSPSLTSKISQGGRKGFFLTQKGQFRKVNEQKKTTLSNNSHWMQTYVFLLCNIFLQKWHRRFSLTALRQRKKHPSWTQIKFYVSSFFLRKRKVVKSNTYKKPEACLLLQWSQSRGKEAWSIWWSWSSPRIISSSKLSSTLCQSGIRKYVIWICDCN